MPVGGYRPGAGRPKGAKDKKPRKPRKTAKTRPKRAKPDGNREKIKQLLGAGALAKAKIYQEFLQRLAAGERLNLAEKKLMDKLGGELAAEVGEKQNKPAAAIPEDIDSPEFLRRVWNDPSVDMALRVRAAEIVFRDGSEGKKSKKQEREDRAKQAGSGKFAPAAPPQLKRVK